ncbi:MAG: hypothetical protein ACI85O_002154 [Saprospiraceae bacterium]|jgi:hypothetical protein
MTLNNSEPMNFLSFTQSFLTVICLIVGVSQVTAQKLNTSQLVVPEDVELTEAQEDQIIDAAEQVFTGYANKASLIDPLENKVNQNSLREFKSLFYSGAKIVNDLSRYFVISNFADYGGTVYEYMTSTGAVYDPIAGGLLREIDYDKSGYYKAKIVFRKTMHNGLETNNDVFRCKSGRDFVLTMTVRIEEDNLSRARILRIGGQKGTECSDPFLSAGFNLEGGVDAGLSDGFAEEKDLAVQEMLTNPAQPLPNNLDRTINGINYFGAGVNALLPLTKKEAIFLNVGVMYNLYMTETTFNGTYTFEENLSDSGITSSDNSSSVYHKEVFLDNLIDNSTIHTLQFPIGIRLSKKPKQGRKYNLMLDVMALPTLALFGKTEQTVKDVIYAGYFNGELNTDLADKIQNVRFLGFGNEVPTGMIESSPEKRDLIGSSVFSLAVRLSPGFRYRLTDNIIAEGSLNINYGINSFTETADPQGEVPFSDRPLQDNGNDFNYTNELGGSLLENYYDSVPVSTIGLRLGVVYVFR